ncbi:PREDICTED: protein RRNAD1 [Cyprinodon variegatus]|uniref:Methyltransferase like 25B n=1 Tax=Cyprinodon variegatus TaxID=28743 RepID=A0A3Q2DCJ7_CYPVA|nr:PREDICTED: protein RRNAD1 [Cyprinodon variegatus]
MLTYVSISLGKSLMSAQQPLPTTQDVGEFTATFTAEQQRELAKKITAFLSHYGYLSDSFIIEFFTENLWQTLPSAWQAVLQDLSYLQTADLLLDASPGDRRYPSVWPLSLLAFRSTAHALAFPRGSRPQRGRATGSGKPDEFLKNHSQSSLLGHIFRKHVKPKKQHEIRKLGVLVKQLCDQTGCKKVVDVGSGQGHLTRFLSFGLGLSVTAIEADHTLAAMASRYDAELLWVLEKENRKKGCSFQLPEEHCVPRHIAGWVNPKASWEAFIKQLKDADHVIEGPQSWSGPSKKRRSDVTQNSKPGGFSLNPNMADGEQILSEGSCSSDIQSVSVMNPEECCDFVLTGLHACGDLSATLLRHFVSCPRVRGITSVACCYMKITTKENPAPPGLISPPTPPTPSSESFPFEFGYPMSSWVRGLHGHQLSYKAREGACHAVEDYVRRLREESQLLKTHCYRAILETFIREARPDLRRAGIQTIKKAHLLAFTEYARLGLPRVGLPSDLPLDQERVEAMLKQQNKVVVYFSLSLLLAPVVETLVLLDRMIYLEENGVKSQLIPLFNPNFSPRNFVLVALKPSR